MKKKKYLLLAIVLVLMSFTGYLVSKIIITKQQNAIVKSTKQTLPNFTFYNLDSLATNSTFIKKGKSVCIFYFNAECEYCQNEARDISKNIALFKDTQIVMVSFNTIADIKKFALEYGLNYPNIVFLQDPKFQFSSWFGKSSIPSVFIYNAQHRLVKEYQGETKIEAIIKYL
ncbi:TlpA disulfide reductase family protein [Daejeonella sp.]|uniref:peroxiredoxin family protein n=1 Tax=Daejeonella sp. TaxID=2805397 RepID=UPI0025B9C458|nr:TlpA disulfide reductase family protein [Daejeonella sp.]